MRIDGFRTENNHGLTRVAATVHWEAVERPATDVYFEVPDRFADQVVPRPEAFLTTAILPAMRLGEARVAIDGEICPDLLSGLDAATAWIRRWNPRRRPIRIEATSGCAHSATSNARVAGCLMSGGVDSLALLRWNALRYPTNHPRRIRRCIALRGVWSVQQERPDDGRVQAQHRLTELERTVTDLGPAAEDAGATILPVFTNVQNLSDADIPFWHREYQGAGLVSVAHVLADDIDSLSIAGWGEVASMRAWGSHPLLEPNYGSHDLQIHHSMETWSRLDKVKLLSEWDAGLSVLRVCNRDPSKTGNCGRCEKCMRTMLALLVWGGLDRTPTFPHEDLQVEDLARLLIPYHVIEPDYEQMASMLRESGRDDLAGCIRRRIQVSRAIRARKRLTRRIRAADERFLGGSLVAVRQRMRLRRAA